MKDTQQPTVFSLSKKDREKAAGIMSDAVKKTRRTVKRLNKVMQILPKGESKEIDPRHIC